MTGCLDSPLTKPSAARREKETSDGLFSNVPWHTISETKRLPRARSMKTHCTRLYLVILLGLMLSWVASAKCESIEFHLQRRGKANEVLIEPTCIDAKRLGVVVVDIWNWHWCKTAAARVNSFVPRMNECLRILREQGATIFVCPTDVVDAYVGLPQRESALALELWPLPEPQAFECPDPPNGPGCACLQRCRGNYGWNQMNPSFVLGDNDLMPNSRAALYSLAKQRGITHLLYMGVHTQVCLLGKDIGLRNMKALGFECILARDLTDSHPDYAPDRGVTPDELTERTVAHFERYLCATVNLKHELERLNLWTDKRPVDPVRAAPWGTRTRPHIFDGRTMVTLSTPLNPDADIYFTTDGGPPTPKSTPYESALHLTQDAVIRAQAFHAGQAVAVESEFVYFRRPNQPPHPDVHLADIDAASALGPGHSPSDGDHRLSPVSQGPQSNRSNRGQPLRMNGREYKHGVGVHAPNRLAYRVDPSWTRFVAEVGIDENIISQNFASDLGCQPSVVFRIFLDGKLAAESPIMRFMHPSWRFDVAIPSGTKQIVLATLPTADGNREDLANWVNAGFVMAR